MHEAADINDVLSPWATHSHCSIAATQCSSCGCLNGRARSRR